ncbi:MAG: DUF167 domain-containing protein [Chloroflexota bacterium]
MAKIRVRVQPGARKDEIVGLQEELLRVKVAAPPVEGRANTALIAFLAKHLGVRKGDIDIVAGHTSRDKVVEVHGLDDEEVRRRLRGS